MITLNNISKSYDSVEIIKNISVSFQPQKITVIVGPSGEGKSTIFRIITNLIKPTSGDVQKDQEDSIGMVFQNNALYPHLSVLNNLVLPQRVVLKRSKVDAIKKAKNVLEQLAISDLLKKTISTLSGGEAQRVAIARSVVMDNNIILFDEPTSALDEQNTYKLETLLQELKQTKTIIIITHDLPFANRVADISYQLQNKRLTKI